MDTYNTNEWQLAPNRVNNTAVQMIDRELLELAVKASGETVDPRSFDNELWMHIGLRLISGHYFNPLNDAGDRYLLVKKLCLKLDFSQQKVSSHDHLFVCFWGRDLDEAHAVLTVAAEIWKQLHEKRCESHE